MNIDEGKKKSLPLNKKFLTLETFYGKIIIIEAIKKTKTLLEGKTHFYKEIANAKLGGDALAIFHNISSSRDLLYPVGSWTMIKLQSHLI